MISDAKHIEQALNRWQDAATCFERVVALSDSNDKALYELGLCYAVVIPGKPYLLLFLGVLYQDKITPRNHDKV
jgi:hypothetical protein